jgi:hypothetical protein
MPGRTSRATTRPDRREPLASGDAAHGRPPYGRVVPAAESPPSAAQMSDEEASALLALMKGADGVELKLTVPDSERRSAVSALGLDPLDAQLRQVWFLDTPDLALDRHGVVARVRRIQRRPHDSVVKLRPVVPERLDEELRRSPDFVVEVDAMPGGHVCSASLKGRLGDGDVLDAVAGRRPVRKLFSRSQRAFFDAHAPEGLALGDLAFLGPINVLKLKCAPPELGRRLAVELWLYPDGSRIMELSTRCLPTEAFQVAAEARAFLTDQGVELTGEQQTKTRTALTFFSGELREAS